MYVFIEHNQQILAKACGRDDDDGDDDQEELMNAYKNPENSVAERLAIHNAVRGCRRAQQYYEYKPDQKEDVFFDLIDIDKITIGQQFQVKVRLCLLFVWLKGDEGQLTYVPLLNCNVKVFNCCNIDHINYNVKYCVFQYLRYRDFYMYYIYMCFIITGVDPQ